MPAVYPSSGNIGALLRLIEQERKSAPHARFPTAAPSAPMRRSVSAPLESPIAAESPGTARVVSIKPEIAPPAAGAAPPSPVAPTTAKMGAVGGVPKVIGPTTYIPPVTAPPSAPVARREPTPAPARPTRPQPKVVKPTTYTPPRLATRVSVSPPTRNIGRPMEEARATWARTQAPIEQTQRELAEINRRIKAEEERLRKELLASVQQAVWSAPSPPKRKKPARFRYEKKKAPSRSEKLANWLRPITSWFSRWF